MNRFDDLSQQLSALSSRGRLRRLRPRDTEGVHVIDADGSKMINFGGNDYLGLAAEPMDFTHPLKDLPTGSGASALVSGWSSAHQRLADEIADFESTEAAVVFPTGYAACSGTVATLAGADDLILSDQLNHASLIDGCRLSRATKVVYPHRDCAHVEQVLRQQRHKYRRVWIVTDGVFSMDGRIAPLVELCDLAQRYEACVIADEAHGTGVLGDSGRGASEELQVEQGVTVRIGTLSKAIGSQGGFVAGPRVIIDFLINHCRSLIYSTSLAPPAVAAALRGFAVIRQQPQRREKVRQLARRLRQRLNIQSDGTERSIPIVPLIIGADGDTVNAAKMLAEAGFYAPAIRPPTVPEGTARLRVTLSAAHEESMIDQLATTLSGVIAEQ